MPEQSSKQDIDPTSDENAAQLERRRVFLEDQLYEMMFVRAETPASDRRR